MVRLMPQLFEEIIRQLVNFEKCSQLDMMDSFFSEDSKQPLIGITVLDGIGLDPEMQLKAGRYSMGSDLTPRCS
ncbi:MAG: hypothetical protein DYH02_16965 [Candidatus Omnitrophica bacterium COP1]|nr:hypothetical protein [Candidatus Omnitrophica bacterium COP1]